jgi:hypothetical protein
MRHRPGLLARGRDPFTQHRIGEHGVAVCRGHRSERNAIRGEAQHHRCIHRVGNAVGAEEPRARCSVLLPRARPGRFDTRDVARELVRHRHAAARADVHRHLRAQRLEAGVHLAADRTRHRADLGRRRPAPPAGELAAVFADGERIPDAHIPMHEHRHTARDVERGDVLSELGSAQR